MFGKSRIAAIAAAFSQSGALLVNSVTGSITGRAGKLLISDELAPRYVGGYNRHRAITAATSKRAAAKRRNLRKRSPH